MIEHREYEDFINCNICLSLVKECVFYECSCKSIQIKICYCCSFNKFESCSCDNNEILFFHFYFN